MTDGERSEEGAEETVEDLEAPASAQGDVAGGDFGGCPGKPSFVCAAPTCTATKVVCRAKDTMHDLVVYEQ
jgi:hypothetical protein